jgi:hypothetical protein
MSISNNILHYGVSQYSNGSYIRQIRLLVCHIEVLSTAYEQPERLWGPPSLLFNGYQGLFPWG